MATCVSRISTNIAAKLSIWSEEIIKYKENNHILWNITFKLNEAKLSFLWNGGTMRTPWMRAVLPSVRHCLLFHFCCRMEVQFWLCYCRHDKGASSSPLWRHFDSHVWTSTYDSICLSAQSWTSGICKREHICLLNLMLIHLANVTGTMVMQNIWRCTLQSGWCKQRVPPWSIKTTMTSRSYLEKFPQMCACGLCTTSLIGQQSQRKCCLCKNIVMGCTPGGAVGETCGNTEFFQREAQTKRLHSPKLSVGGGKRFRVITV